MSLPATFTRSGSTLNQVKISPNGKVVIYRVHKPRTSLKTYEVARLINGVYPSLTPAKASNNLVAVNRRSDANRVYKSMVAGHPVVTNGQTF